MFQPDGDATIQVGKSEHWLHDELLSTLSAQDQHVPMGLRLPDQQPHQDKPPQESAPSSFQLFATDVGTVLKAQPPWHDKMWPALERLHSATHAFCEPGQADPPLEGIDISALVAKLLAMAAHPPRYIGQYCRCWTEEAIAILANIADAGPKVAAYIALQPDWVTAFGRAIRPETYSANGLPLDEVGRRRHAATTVDVLGLLVNITDKRTLLVAAGGGTTSQHVVPKFAHIVEILHRSFEDFGLELDGQLSTFGSSFQDDTQRFLYLIPRLIHRVWSNMYQANLLDPALSEARKHQLDAAEDALRTSKVNESLLGERLRDAASREEASRQQLTASDEALRQQRHYRISEAARHEFLATIEFEGAEEPKSIDESLRQQLAASDEERRQTLPYRISETARHEFLATIEFSDTEFGDSSIDSDSSELAWT